MNEESLVFRETEYFTEQLQELVPHDECREEVMRAIRFGIPIRRYE